MGNAFRPSAARHGEPGGQALTGQRINGLRPPKAADADSATQVRGCAPCQAARLPSLGRPGQVPLPAASLPPAPCYKRVELLPRLPAALPTLLAAPTAHRRPPPPPLRLQTTLLARRLIQPPAPKHSQPEMEKVKEMVTGKTKEERHAERAEREAGHAPQGAYSNVTRRQAAAQLPLLAEQGPRAHYLSHAPRRWEPRTAPRAPR